MSAVFTIGDADFDDLDEDEEFLKEAFNFESNQLRNRVPSNNEEIGNVLTNNTDNKVPDGNSINRSNKHNLLRSKGSSVNTSTCDTASFSGYLRSSSLNSARSDAKRMGNFNDLVTSEPPLKKQNYVKENRILCSKNGQESRNNASEHTERAGKMSAESNRLTSDINISKRFDFNSSVKSKARNKLSNGLRYTQNTSSAVSSPMLTNNRQGSLSGSNIPPAIGNSSFDERSEQATNLFKQSTPNRYKGPQSTRDLFRKTTSPSINKQTAQFRSTTIDSSNYQMESEAQNDRISTPNRVDSNLLTTPNRYTHQNSSTDKFQNAGSTNPRTPKHRGFAKETPGLGHLRTPTAEKRCVTPRRFPGPAGILPRLDPAQSMDDSQSPLSETPRKKASQLRQLITCDNDEDFYIEPWISMHEKLARDFSDSSDVTLASVIRRAASNELERGKVSFLAVLLKSFHPTGSDISVVLKDPSGEMRGTLHRKVLEQQQVELGPGCGLFLKQVSVFSPSPRKHYLNITPGNILEIFPANADQCSTQKVSETIQKCGSIEKEERNVPSKNSNREVIEAQSVVETNFDDLLEGLDDDDDILAEAMNI